MLQKCKAQASVNVNSFMSATFPACMIKF